MDEITMKDFMAQVAGDDPTPGGGSVSALAGSLGASLAQMVAGLTIGKKKYVDVEEQMKDIQAQGAKLQIELEAAIAKDAEAFDAVMAAFRLPKATDEDKAARRQAIQDATKLATEVPLDTARKAMEVIELASVVADKGNTNAVTDAGVAALLGLAAVEGALLNVSINLGGLKDVEYRTRIEQDAETLRQQARAAKESTLATVESKL